MTVGEQNVRRAREKVRRFLRDIVQVVSGGYHDFIAFVVVVPVAGYVAFVVGTIFRPSLEQVIGTILSTLLISTIISLLINSNIPHFTNTREDDENEGVTNTRPGLHFFLPILLYLVSVPLLAIFGPNSLIGPFPLLFATTSLVYRTSRFGRVVHSANMGPNTARGFLGIACAPITAGGGNFWLQLFPYTPTDPRGIIFAGYEIFQIILYGLPLFLSTVYIAVQFAASIPARIAGQRPGRPKQVHEHLTKADELRTEAESLHHSGEYDDALDAYEHAIESIDTAKRVAHFEYGYTREDSRIDAIRSSILEAQEDIAKAKISSLREQAEQLASKADSTREVLKSEETSETIGGYYSAIDRYGDVIDKHEDAIDVLEEAIQMAKKQNSVSFGEVIFELKNQRDECKEAIEDIREDAARQAVSSLQEQAEQLASKADSTREVLKSEETSETIEGYNDAIDRYRDVIDKYEDAIDALEMAIRMAKKHDSPIFSDLISELQTQRDECKEAIKDIQEDAARQAVQQLQTSADDILSEARDNRQAGDYDAAIGAYHRAQEVFEKAIDAAKQGQCDTTEFENEISEIDDAIKETMQERAIDELTVHRERIDELVANADSARDADDFETAIDAYKAASDTCREAIELADGHSLSARSNRFQDRLDDLDATQQEAKLDHIAHRLGLLTDRTEVENDYGSLEEAYQTLLEEIDALVVDSERERALSNLEQKALHGRIQARIEHGRDQMRRGVDAFEQEAYGEAVETFEAAVDHFEATHDLATEYNFSDEQDELEQLIDTCETNADTATNGKLGILDADQSVLGPAAATSDHGTSTPVELPDRNRVGPTEIGWSTTARNSDWFANTPPTHDRLKELGSGGHARVFAVELDRSGRQAALKVPKWQGTMDQRVMESFAEEAAAWSRIDDHDHIVNIYDWGGSPQPWILLEYMEGGSLAERVEAITPARSVDMFVQVCEAIHHAHHTVDVGAHLDLKPENILFTDHTDDAVPKVSDWGMAKGALKRTGSSAGWTPEYAAPEQIAPGQFGDTETKTDVYQLGVVAYELLTGQRPFEYDSPTALKDAIRTEFPTPPSQITDLPPGVDEPILTALSKRKTERQETVLYLRDGISEAFE